MLARVLATTTSTARIGNWQANVKQNTKADMEEASSTHLNDSNSVAVQAHYHANSRD